MSADGSNRVQQFPVIAALNERITRGDTKKLSPYTDARSGGNKNEPANARYFARSRVRRCLSTVRLNQPHAPKQCAAQSFLYGGAAARRRAFISEPFLISVPKQY